MNIRFIRPFAITILGLFAVVTLLASFIPVSLLAQSNCKAEFALYHPKAPTGQQTLQVDDLTSPVEVVVNVPASSLGFFPCGKQARFLYSWSNDSDNFSLNQGSTVHRVMLTKDLGIPKGSHRIKFQTSNSSTVTSTSFNSVYYELTLNLTVGKGPQGGGGGGGGGGDGDDTGGGDGDDTGGGGGTDVDSSVKVTGRNFDEVIGRFSNPLEFETIPELIVRLINIGLLIAAMIAVAVIILGGFQMVTSAGNETRLTNGKKAVTWAVGGLVICLLSFSIVAIIERVIAR